MLYIYRYGYNNKEVFIIQAKSKEDAISKASAEFERIMKNKSRYDWRYAKEFYPDRVEEVKEDIIHFEIYY